MFSEDISHRGKNALCWHAWNGTHQSRVAVVRAWLFVAFAIGFGALGASIWMCVDAYENQSDLKAWPGTVRKSSSSRMTIAPHSSYSFAFFLLGVALVLQNVIILLSSVLLLFARKTDEEEVSMM